MRYISCFKCGGTQGTMIKVEEGKYAHQKESTCNQEGLRAREAIYVMRKPKSNLVIAKSKIYLPR